MRLDASPLSSSQRISKRSEEAALLHLHQAESLHRLEKIREVLSSVLSSKKNISVSANSISALASVDHSSHFLETTGCDPVCFTRMSAAAGDSRQGRTFLESSSPAGRPISECQSDFDSRCYQRLLAAEKEIIRLRREKNALYLSAHEREEELSRLVLDFNNPVSSSSYSQGVDIDKVVGAYPNEIALCSLRKIAVAAWRVFTVVNKGKLLDSFSSALAEDCGDEEIYREIEKGGEKFRYLLHGLEEMAKEIPNCLAPTGILENTPDTSKRTSGKTKLTVVERIEADAKGLFHETELEKDQEAKENTPVHWRDSHEKRMDKEAMLMRSIRKLEVELQELRTGRNPSDPNTLNVSQTISTESFFQSGSKENSTDALSDQYLMQEAERETKNYAEELKEAKRKLSASETKSETYSQEAEDLKKVVAERLKDFQELKSRYESLTRSSGESKTDTLKVDAQTSKHVEPLQDEIKVLRESIRKIQEDSSARLKESSALVISVIAKLEQLLPKNTKNLQTGCLVVSNDNKKTRSVSDESLVTALNCLQETTQNILHYFHPLTGVAEATEKSVNQMQLTIGSGYNGGVYESRIDLCSMSPSFCVVAAYLMSPPCCSQDTETENRNVSSGSVKEGCLSYFDAELIPLSRSLQSECTTQSIESKKVPFVTTEMLASSTGHSSGVFYEVGGTILKAVGLLTLSSQRQWDRLLRSTQHFLEFFVEHHPEREHLNGFISAAANSVLLSYSVLAPQCSKEGVQGTTDLLIMVLAMLFAPISSLRWEISMETLLCNNFLEQRAWEVVCKIIEDSAISHADSGAAVEGEESIFPVDGEERIQFMHKLREVLCGDWHRRLLTPLVLLGSSSQKSLQLFSEFNMTADTQLDRMEVTDERVSYSRKQSFLYSSGPFSPVFLHIFIFLSQLSLILETLRLRLQLQQSRTAVSVADKDDERLAVSALFALDTLILPSCCLLMSLPDIADSGSVVLQGFQTQPLEKPDVRRYLLALVPFFLQKRSYFWNCWVGLQGTSEQWSETANCTSTGVKCTNKEVSDELGSVRKLYITPQYRVEEWCQSYFFTPRWTRSQGKVVEDSTAKGNEDIDSITEILEGLLPELLRLYKENRVYRLYLEDLIDVIG